ncbi:MAG TPA: hypothetical protein VMT61_13915 [Candidatus Binataceae bacterium]|nr:hypothetical protein [Candidatus Binataceae bacterium]
MVALLCSAGCSTQQEKLGLASKSTQALQYYPFQVKGFQNTYPKRSAAVLQSTDARAFDGVAPADRVPDGGNPAIGVVTDDKGKVAQRLYGPALGPLFQDAIAHAAQEAGFAAIAANDSLQVELSARKVDYVIDTKIVRCWVVKSRVPVNVQGGAIWHATADVAVDISIYKPPFNVPFWQGESASIYNDPPPTISGDVSDEAEIYEQPGEVLSVAITRAVAGIFKREDLHNLIAQDSMRAPHP